MFKEYLKTLSKGTKFITANALINSIDVVTLKSSYEIVNLSSSNFIMQSRKLDRRAAERLESSKPMLLCCDTGLRSILTANTLNQMGLDCFVLEGGINNFNMHDVKKAL